MMKIQKLTPETKQDLLGNLLKRNPGNYGAYEAGVREILDKIQTEGDRALFDYTEKFDGVRLDGATIQVTEEEIQEAYESMDPSLLDVMRKSMENIRVYHEKQKRNSWFDSSPEGIILGQKVTPLKRVGVYVPGGKAAYPSSVLMNVIPARVAGVDEIIMVTPPEKTDVSARLRWLPQK